MKTPRAIANRWARWRQFSLRRLLVLMLLAGLLLGWFGRELHAARRRAKVVRQIETAQGSIAYDYQFTTGRIDSDAQPSSFRRACGDWLGRDLVHELVRIDAPLYVPPAMRGQSLDGLEHCTQLREASLGLGLGTDENLARLSHAQRLNRLYVLGPVSDQGMKQLESLAELEELVLWRDRPSRQNLTVLPASPGLSELGLLEIPRQPKLLNRITQYARLKSLCLHAAGLTDADLEPLAKLERLELLRISSNGLKGPGLASLTRLPRLRILNLDNTDIGDEALVALQHCPKLERLTVRSTRCTFEGVQRLRRLRPDLTIDDGSIRSTGCSICPSGVPGLLSLRPFF